MPNHLPPLDRLKLLLNSSSPLVIVETVEEARALELIRRAAFDLKLPVFEWSVAEGRYDTRTEIKFEPLGDRETLVSITESGWDNTPEGIKSSYGNCFGWTQMMASLKAFVEYGINLRKGWF